VAKQAALAHTLFNVFGAIAVASTFWITWGNSDVPAFFRMINSLSDGGDLPRHIANAHTLFNVVTTLMLAPFIPLLAKICEKVIPVESKVKYRRLEPHLLDTPAIALSQTSLCLRKMLKKAWKMVDCALNIYNRNDALNQANVKRLEERERRVDDFLPPSQAKQIPLLIHCANDAERIGDHTEIIRKLIAELTSSGSRMSETAEAEFTELHDLLSRQADCTLALLAHHTPEKASEADRFKEEMVRLTGQFETNHLRRLNTQECLPATGVFYIELLSEIRKVSRHLANITDRSGVFYERLCRKGKTA